MTDIAYINLPRKRKVTGQADVIEDWPMTRSYYDELCRDYPTLNVDLELKSMRAWLLKNPSRTPIQPVRFIKNWLAKAKPRAAGGVPEAASQHYAVVAERNRTEEPFIPAREETVKRELGRVKQMLGMR